MPERMVAIDGDTYPVREQLKALGGRWDASGKTWMVPASQAEIARTLAAPSAVWACDECGAALYRPYCPECRDEMFIRRVR